ncbi:MAG: GIY-YIG nuclease family protein [bacterium]
MENYFYTYVLLCSDGKHYVGSSSDVLRRFNEHTSGKVHTTSRRLPVKLVYFEACLSKAGAEARERYFKTGFGRKYIKERIK